MTARGADEPAARRAVDRRWIVAVVVLVVAAVAVVLVARLIRATPAGAAFVHAYPGAAPLPAGAPVGFPAWLAWQHGLNALFLLLTVRSGWRLHRADRPTVVLDAPQRRPHPHREPAGAHRARPLVALRRRHPLGAERRRVHRPAARDRAVDADRADRLGHRARRRRPPPCSTRRWTGRRRTAGSTTTASRRSATSGSSSSPARSPCSPACGWPRASPRGCGCSIGCCRWD